MKKTKRKYISIILCSLALLLVAVGVATWIILSHQTGSVLPFIVKSDLSVTAGPTASLNNVTAIFAGETQNFTFDASNATVVYKKNADDAGRKIPGTWTLDTMKSTSSTTVKTNTVTLSLPCDTCCGDGKVYDEDSKTNVTCSTCNGGKTKSGSIDHYYLENVAFTATFTPDGIYEYLFNGCTATVNLNLYAVAKYGSTYYTTIDGALAAANGNGKNGSGTVYALASGDYTNFEEERAKIAKTITTAEINSGVTLVIPYKNGQGIQTSDRYALSPTTTSTSTELDNIRVDFLAKAQCVNAVTLKSNTGIFTNKGRIEVCGITGYPYPNSKYPQASTTGLHGTLFMENTELIMDSSTSSLETHGYVIDNGGSKITAKKGNIVMPFAVYDYSGGTVTVALFKGSGSAFTLIGSDNTNISPFTTFDMPNIQAELTCYGGADGATLSAVTSLTTNGIFTIPSQYNPAEFDIFGDSGALFNMADGYATFHYNKENIAAYKYKPLEYVPHRNATTDIVLNGTTSSGDISMSINAGFGDTTVSLSAVKFPVSDKIHLHLTGEYEYQFTTQYKFLPGSELHITDGASVTISESSGLLFYPSINVTNGASIYKSYYNKSKAATPAQCNVADGSLTVKGSIGGNITASDPTAVLDLSGAASLSMTETEGNGTRESLNFTFTAKETITQKANALVQTNTIASTNLWNIPFYATSQGTEWRYQVKHTVSYQTNGGTALPSVQTPTVWSNEGVILEGESYLPTTSEKEYYGFDKWFLDSGLTKLADGATIYSNTTLYAAWTPTPYTVKFEYKYSGFTPVTGTEPPLPVGDFGFTVETGSIQMPTAPESEYIFNGWYTNESFTAASKITSISGKELLALNNGNTIYGQWVELQYTISFGEDKYGDNLAQYNNTYTPEQIATITLPDIKDYSTDTEKESYYTGWLCNGVHYDAGTNLMELLRDGVREYIITPDWIQKAAIKYTANTNVYTDLVTYDSIFWHPLGSTVNLPSLKSHDSATDASHTYYLASWTLNGEAFDISNAGAQYTVTGDTTFHITWGNKTVVTINYNGTHQNTLGLSNETVYLAPGHSYTISHNLKAGDNDKSNSLYFVGLSGSDCGVSGNTVTATTNAATATVTASWASKIVLNVNYGNNDLGLKNKTVYLLPGESYTITDDLTAGDDDPAKGKVFNGLSGDGNCTVDDSTYTVTPNSGVTSATVTVNWKDKVAVTLQDIGTTYYPVGTVITFPTSISGKTGLFENVGSDDSTKHFTVLNYWTPDDGTTQYKGGVSYTVTGAVSFTYSITHGEEYYKVTISATNSTITVEGDLYSADGTSMSSSTSTCYARGSVKVSISASFGYQNPSITIGNASHTSGQSTNVGAPITITGSAESCIAAGTLITLADGTQKKVEDLTLEDQLLVFNHETGRYEVAGIIFIENDGWDYYNVINLAFSNGTVTRIIYEHALFDITLNKYVYITEANYTEFIGHEFAVQNGNAIDTVTMTDAFVTREYTGCYSLVTTYHLNYFIDGLFSIPGGIDGLFNIFEYGDGLKYDEEKMNADIEKYGLFTYEDFADYIPEEVYEMFPAAYFKVAIGKGMLTFEDILGYIDQFLVKNGII